MGSIYNIIMNVISDVSIYGIILNCLLIIIESIVPPLPLGVFITILFINYGLILGFIISWIFTVIGCVISFYLFQTVFKNVVDKYVRKNKTANKFILLIDNIKFSHLVLIISIPFTPAFLINIAAGISKIDIKKFLPAVMIGKISLVLFWGLVGTNLINSFKDPVSLLKVIIILTVTFIITKIVNNKFDIN